MRIDKRNLEIFFSVLKMWRIQNFLMISKILHAKKVSNLNFNLNLENISLQISESSLVWMKVKYQRKGKRKGEI